MFTRITEKKSIQNNHYPHEEFMKLNTNNKIFERPLTNIHGEKPPKKLINSLSIHNNYFKNNYPSQKMNNNVQKSRNEISLSNYLNLKNLSKSKTKNFICV